MRLPNILVLTIHAGGRCTLLMKAMKGMGTDEGAIARILGGSTKAECAAIHARYDEKYGGNLIGQLKVGGWGAGTVLRALPAVLLRDTRNPDDTTASIILVIIYIERVDNSASPGHRARA